MFELIRCSVSKPHIFTILFLSLRNGRRWLKILNIYSNLKDVENLKIVQPKVIILDTWTLNIKIPF